MTVATHDCQDPICPAEHPVAQYRLVAFDYPDAIQTVAALEQRAEMFEFRLAAGTVAADDAELVITASLRAAAAVRRSWGLWGDPKDPGDRAALSLEALPASWRRWWVE